jgi:hypothetical protein
MVRLAKSHWLVWYSFYPFCIPLSDVWVIDSFQRSGGEGKRGKVSLLTTV